MVEHGGTHGAGAVAEHYNLICWAQQQSLAWLFKPPSLPSVTRFLQQGYTS